MHKVAWPGELEARGNAIHRILLQVHQAAQRWCVRRYERARQVLNIDVLEERIGCHIATEVVKGEPVEEMPPFELVCELRGRERLRRPFQGV